MNSSLCISVASLCLSALRDTALRFLQCNHVFMCRCCDGSDVVLSVALLTVVFHNQDQPVQTVVKAVLEGVSQHPNSR